MEESGTKLHIPLVLKYFVLFPQKLSVCGRVPLSLSAAGLPPYLTFRTSHPVIEAGKEADLIFLFDGSKLPVEEKGTITLPVVLTGLEGVPEQRTITLVIKLD